MSELVHDGHPGRDVELLSTDKDLLLVRVVKRQGFSHVHRTGVFEELLGVPLNEPERSQHTGLLLEIRLLLPG
jgi:hypothetical protein